MPVARDVGETAAAVGGAGPVVSGAGVEACEAAQLDRPMIVIELPGEEKRAGEAVIFRAMVSVVLVGADSMATETVVLRHIGRQAVEVAEENRLAVLAQH